MTRSTLAVAFALVTSFVGFERVALADTYSLPWQLRPVESGNLVRVESAAIASNDTYQNLDVASATTLTASYQATEHWSPMIALGFVANNAPGAALDGRSFGNPIVGAMYTRPAGRYRMALSWATTIPIGTGGGDVPDPRIAKTNTTSMSARLVDRSMFEVDYLTESVGGDVAYVNHGVTAQVEATLQQGVRVRGSDSAEGTDTFRTDAALALHVGTFVGSHVSLGGDLRYERWLSHPTTLDAMSGARVPLPEASLDTLTAAVGMRVHFPIGERTWIHPGISYTRGLDDWSHAVAVDVPVQF